MAYTSSTLYNGLFIVNGNVLMGSNVASSGPLGYPEGSTRLFYSGDDFSHTASQYYTGTHLQLKAQGVKTTSGGVAQGGSIFLEGGRENSGVTTHGSIQFITGGFEAMRVASNGYVGINISTPLYNLDVNGRTNISQLLNVSTISSGNLKVTGIISATGDISGRTISGNNIVAGGTISATGNITASGVFTGNGSGLSNVINALTAGSAGTATYAVSAGSAPADKYNPITLYNMSASNSGALTFTKVGENFYQHYGFFGQPDWSSYTPPTGAVPLNFTPAIGIYSDTGNKMIFAVAQGSGNVASFGGSYGGISDSNLKENIYTARDYTEDLCKLRVVKYNFIDDPTYIPFVSTYTSTVTFYDQSISTTKLSTISITISTSKHRQIGFIAQEVQEIFPGIIETQYIENRSTLSYTSCLSVKISILTPMLVTAVQNLKMRLDSHESTITGQAEIIKLFLSTLDNPR